MNKWFNNVFLPSIFERAGVNKPLWLSVKQTAVCTDNMPSETVMVPNDIGGYYYRVVYFCEWQERKVSLAYSKKNGCGSITFGANADEKRQARIEQDIEKEQKRAALLERLRNWDRGDSRYQRRRESIQKRYETALAYLRGVADEYYSEDRDEYTISEFILYLNDMVTAKEELDAITA